MPHLLATQVALPLTGIGQAMPQLLQLSGLEVTSMHAPLQFLRPPLQPLVHLALSHTGTAEHAVSQSPQRVGSLETSMQAPEQSLKPVAHSTPHLPS